MEHMAEFPEEYLPQANRSLTFIRLELLQLANLCEYMQMYRLNPKVFQDLEYNMLKILHKTRAVCNPPTIKPKKSDFDVVKHLASGSFGTVSHVRHKQTHQSFAMKQIKKNEQMQALVLMERDILTYLEHPFIIHMFCSFETKRHMYMVMEYAGGGNCLELLMKHSPLSLEVSCFYIAELILAVQHLHSLGIIHRDLKPENLLISSQGHMKVADFGLAKIGSMTMVDYHHDAEAVAEEFIDGESFGTIRYMAPELFLGTGYGKPVDWWAIGCILFNFLFGTMPFLGETIEMYKENVINGQILWPMNIPYDTGNLLSCLLDTNPVTRAGTRGACEVKACPFFHNVYWDFLRYQRPPCVPELEDMTSCSQVFPSLELMEDQSGLRVHVSEFCHVGFRFSEVYGSPKSLWTVGPQNHFPPAIMPGPSEEQQELMEHDESFEEEDEEDEEEEENLLGLSDIPQHTLDLILPILDEDDDYVEEGSNSEDKLQNCLVNASLFLEMDLQNIPPKPTVEESGEDKKPTAEESPPEMKTLKSKSKLRRNPVKTMLLRCLWILNPFRACWPSAV